MADEKNLIVAALEQRKADRLAKRTEALAKRAGAPVVAAQAVATAPKTSTVTPVSKTVKPAKPIVGQPSIIDRKATLEKMRADAKKSK